MSGVKLVHFNADIHFKKKCLLEYISWAAASSYLATSSSLLVVDRAGCYGESKGGAWSVVCVCVQTFRIGSPKTSPFETEGMAACGVWPPEPLNETAFQQINRFRANQDFCSAASMLHAKRCFGPLSLLECSTSSTSQYFWIQTASFFIPHASYTHRSAYTPNTTNKTTNPSKVAH